MAMCMITGIPECGKTVLLSTLVLKRREVFFPKNREAQKFEEEAKQLDRQLWPAPTNALASHRPMQWDITYKSRKRRLIVADNAGESWDAFVSENQEPDSVNPAGWKKKVQDKINNLTKEQKADLQTIEGQFQTAACVCILIDLTQDINNGENFRQIRFVQSVMNYLDKIGRKKCPIALVVTKCNMYGNREEWEKIFQTNYLDMFKIHWKGKVKPIFTDAVKDTCTNKNNQLVPAPNFSSQGLDELIDFLVERVFVKETLGLITYAVMVIGIISFLAAVFCLMIRFLPTWGILALLVIIIAAVINIKRRLSDRFRRF